MSDEGVGDGDPTQDPGAAKEKLGLKLAIEFGPLAVFFAGNALGGIYVATGAFMVAITLSIFISWRFRGHVPIMLWVTAVIVLVFGGMTIYLNDERFIKLKPTIVNTLFAGILFYGLARGRSYLKLLLEAAFPPMAEAGWRRMTWNWALFFVAMAILNEFIWRNFSTDFWVNFKVFGSMPLTFLFAIAQVPVIIKYQLDDEPD